jgi:hypothetical protein
METVHAIRNGTFTITNVRTMEHRTFQVRTQRDDARFAPGQRILSVLTGPNNTNDYQGIAFLNGGLNVWKRHRGGRFEDYAKFVWKFFNNPEPEWADQFVVEWATTCIRCNRMLTHPLSIAVGIGPDCGDRYGSDYGLEDATIKAMKLEAKIDSLKRGTV